MKKLGFIEQIMSRVLKAYADWRVGARPEEMRNTDERIVLTFDDYGNEVQVTRLLRALEEAGVRAVFFIQGDWADEQPGLVRRLKAAGHLIGNHTYSHRDLLSLSEAEVRSEIGQGVQCAWLRPPQGRYNQRVRAIAAELGFAIKYWSIDSDDWQGVSVEYMRRKILSQLHPGAVILFHIHAAHTPELLPELVAEIRRRGFRLAASGEPIWGQQ